MEITHITRSYTEKIQHQSYGGQPYESSDHFCSLSAELDPSDNVIEVSQQLEQSCRELVESSKINKIAEFSGGIPQQEFQTFLYDYIAERGDCMNPETFDLTRKSMSPAQAKIINIIRRAKATKKRNDPERQ